MAEEMLSISCDENNPIKVLKWKVREGSTVSIGKVLFIHLNAKENDGIQHKFKSPKAGILKKIVAPEGAIAEPGELLYWLKLCNHPTIMNDMCAECGADLRNEKGEVVASVPMIHAIPDLKVSEEQAQVIGRADSDRLLRDRKLVLLVDLDQTLIHTTNDNVPANLKDVYHFQLYGPHSPWYHTRLRPGTHKFLENIFPLFELHICTFGTRNYAHMIATFLDRDQKYFSNRILSRDECFDPTSKKANLKALFPCGDNLVCIIDDREDVWSNASNLIHVKPYHFFRHTGDINAPPGLDKQENDDRSGVDLSSLNTKNNGNVYLNGLDNKTNGNGDVVPDEKENMDEENEIKESNTNETESGVEMSPKVDSNGLEEKLEDQTENSCDRKEKLGEKKEEKLEKKIEDEDKNEEKMQESIVNIDELSKDLRGNNEISEKTTNGEEAKKEENTETKETNEKIEVSQMKKEEQENNEVLTDSESKVVEDSQIENEEQEKPKAATDSEPEKIKGTETQKGEQENTDSEPKTPEDSQIEKEEQENTNFVNSSASRTKNKEKDLIEIEDPDSYLLDLECILKQIHREFYERYDVMESGQVPDLKEVIPLVKSQVLKGKKLYFSGLVPTHQKLEQSKPYLIARSLGAEVTQDLEEDSTHLVAIRPGTAKVNTGKRRKNLKIVTPDWLWCCAERWEHADEKIFPLNGKGSKNRHPPPHCTSPTHVPEYLKPGTPTLRKRTPSGRFMDTINPLMSFSSDDIADMDKEVEDILDDDTDSEEEEGKNAEERPEPPAEEEENSSSSSSSGESLDPECPRQYNKRSFEEMMEDQLGEDNQGEENVTDDEWPSAKFRRGEAVEGMEEWESQDSQNSYDAPDELTDGEWNMMGAALEREFLSND